LASDPSIQVWSSFDRLDSSPFGPFHIFSFNILAGTPADVGYSVKGKKNRFVLLFSFFYMLIICVVIDANELSDPFVYYSKRISSAVTHQCFICVFLYFTDKQKCGTSSSLLAQINNSSTVTNYVQNALGLFYSCQEDFIPCRRLTEKIGGVI
jgi:hypothetical protein